MKNENKTKKQLISELSELRKRNAELKTYETDRKQMKKILRATNKLFEIAFKHKKVIPLLKEFVAEIQSFTKCTAVGIRMLDEEGKIPYEAYEGFSKRFYESESPLSIKSDQCMCINVIREEIDPKLSFYTKSGSFYVNGTTRFLATISKEERGQIRNVCNEFGYESVALIPIRVGRRILGLLHVADRRENMVPLKKAELLEGMMMQLGTAIERVRAEETLRENREMFKEFANLLPQIVFETNERGDFIFVNRYAFEASDYGYTEEDFWNVLQLLAPQDRDRAAKNIQRRLSGEELDPTEYTAIRKDGGTFPILLYANPVFRGNKATGLRGIVIDITERKKAEEKIEQSLREKEMLLDEIHHRVKNNLQIISALIDMTSMRTQNKEMVDLCRGLRAKVDSMGLIHSQLHQTRQFDKLEVESCIHELVEYLSQVYAAEKRFITPIIDSSKVKISLSQAIPCALVLNEVISNAFKHAFKGRKKGTIGISIKKSASDTVFIRVKDNGIGIPEEIDINKVESLGLKLVRNLVQDQLKGKIQVKRNEGTEIIIKFKILNEERKNA